MDIVTIELAGEEIVLKPTLGAMEHLQRKYGNFQKIFDGLSSLDFNCYADVIVAGVLPAKADLGNTKQNVFETGMISLMPDLVEYVGMLLNGGKKPEAKEENPNPEV